MDILFIQHSMMLKSPFKLTLKGTYLWYAGGPDRSVHLYMSYVFMSLCNTRVLWDSTFSSTVWFVRTCSEISFKLTWLDLWAHPFETNSPSLQRRSWSHQMSSPSGRAALKLKHRHKFTCDAADTRPVADDLTRRCAVNHRGLGHNPDHLLLFQHRCLWS